MNFFSLIRYKHFLKNFLICLPIFLDFSNLTIYDFKLFLVCLIGFSFMTNAIYFLNDFTDYSIDKKNILKKKKIVSKKVLLNYFLISIFLMISFLSLIEYFYNKYILIYLINFLFYNFFFKKIFLIDLFLLTNFYIIRILYGFELYGKLEYTVIFLLFLYSIFFALASSKRLVQINVNNLKIKNSIISYSINDLNLLKFLANFSLLTSLILFITYLLNQFLNLEISKIYFIGIEFNDQVVFILFSLIFFYSLFVLYKIINKQIPKDDIFDYFLKKKIFIFFVTIIFIYHFYKYFTI